MTEAEKAALEALEFVWGWLDTPPVDDAAKCSPQYLRARNSTHRALTLLRMKAKQWPPY